jgi:WD40 repeat protein
LCYEEWLDGRLVKSACRPGQYHLKLTLAGDRVLFMDLQRRRRAYIVDYRKGRDIRGIKLPRESEDGILQRFVVSQDGSVGVVSTFALDPGRKILIWSWDLRTGKQLQAMSYTPRNSAITIPNLLALNRDGTYIATTPSILSREIHVLNARTGKTVHVCRIGSGCSALVASPKAAEFACYLDCSIEVWNMATGKRIARFKEDHAAEDSGGLAYSPDGTRLAWVGEQIRVVTIPAVRRE